MLGIMKEGYRRFYMLGIMKEGYRRFYMLGIMEEGYRNLLAVLHARYNGGGVS